MTGTIILKRQIRYRKAPAGYGLALLMVFMASSILIGTSFQLISAPVAMTAMGASSQANLSARQLAIAAMETVEADIQSKLNNGESITTAYRYPASGTVNITTPTDPGNLAGASTVVGNYYATVSLARGHTYIVKVSATASGSTVEHSKLLSMNSTAVAEALLDDIPNIVSIYSFRKLRSAYNGSAIRVRRSTDNAEQDIGFDSDGNLDMASLATFLGGDTSFPLDSVSSALGAYSLRKLRSAYNGSAIRVRRSSDSQEQDIGFDSNGNLDTASLLSFVGTGSGYVKTWYDQSGNSRNMSQLTLARQPRIVNVGVLQSTGGRPTLSFDGSDDFMAITGMSAPITQLTALATAMMTDGTHRYARLLVVHKSGDSNDYTTTGSAIVFDKEEATNKLIAERASGFHGKAPITYGQQFQATSMFNGANHSMRTNGVAGTSTASSGTLTINNMYIGISASGVLSGIYWEEMWLGTVNEIIIYATALSTTYRDIIEKNQGFYYNVFPKAYITTWYDQSVSGRNLTQTTQSMQPLLTSEPRSGRPSLYFNGDGSGVTGQHLLNSNMSTIYTGANISTFGLSAIETGSYDWARVFTLHKTGDANEWSTPNSFQLMAYQASLGSYAVENYNRKVNNSSHQAGDHFQSTVIHTSGNVLESYSNGTLRSSRADASGMNLASNYLILGAGRQNTTVLDHMKGYISEFIGISRAVTASERQTIEGDQKTYYAIP